MEIKSVKENKIEYPKINEMSDKKVKKSIPNKWLKLGITSFIFDILIQTKVFATSSDRLPIVTAGVQVYHNPIYDFVKDSCNVVTIVSLLAFLISGISIIVKKVIAKKQGGNQKIGKKIKIVFITSIILLILSRIGILIAELWK